MSTLETRVFIQDALLPSQFFDRPPPATPEERLLVAVLEEAVDTLRLCHRVATEPKIARRHAEVVAWFADDVEDDAFAFRGLCFALGWDPDATRAGLRAQGLLP